MKNLVKVIVMGLILVLILNCGNSSITEPDPNDPQQINWLDSVIVGKLIDTIRVSYINQYNILDTISIVDGYEYQIFPRDSIYFSECDYEENFKLVYAKAFGHGNAVWFRYSYFTNTSIDFQEPYLIDLTTTSVKVLKINYLK
jgi:hypothetical protein